MTAILTIIALALSAASQYTYTKPRRFKVSITKAEAAQGMAWFNARSAWDSSPVDGTQRCSIAREPVSADFPNGFVAECNGDPETGTVPAAMVPDGATITDVIN